MAKKKTPAGRAERCRLLRIDCRPSAPSLIGDLGTYKSVQAAVDALNADPDMFPVDELIIVTESLKVIEVMSRDVVRFYISNPIEKKTKEKIDG
jgi:hypothetical protein